MNLNVTIIGDFLGGSELDVFDLNYVLTRTILGAGLSYKGVQYFMRAAKFLLLLKLVQCGIAVGQLAQTWSTGHGNR